MPEKNDVPKGLVFFSAATPPGRRRRRLAFAALVLVATLSLLWPVYPLFSGITPMILGLPLSMAWPVCWLIVVFGASVWLYRSDG